MLKINDLIYYFHLVFSISETKKTDTDIFNLKISKQCLIVIDDFDAG